MGVSNISGNNKKKKERECPEIHECVIGNRSLAADRKPDKRKGRAPRPLTFSGRSTHSC